MIIGRGVLQRKGRKDCEDVIHSERGEMSKLFTLGARYLIFNDVMPQGVVSI